MADQQRAIRTGDGLVIFLIAAMLCFGAWSALHRTVVLDERGVGGESMNRLRSPWPEMRIDVNSEGLAELALLPGLGPALAGRIIAEREAHGPFASVDDLQRVKGIGRAIIDRLKPYAVTE